jgi:pimeloyl-ACP methyl ester carboxylesterase
MQPTISQLRGWDLHRLEAAARTAVENARTIDRSLDIAERVLSNATKWFGMTHDAATRRIEQEVDHGREITNVLNGINDDAEDAARLLEDARSFVLQKVDQAVAEGFQVSDTGEVCATDPEREADAGQYQRTIQSCLNEVERLDTSYGRALRTAADDLQSMVNGQPDVLLPSGERIDPDRLVDRVGKMSPDEVAAFMAGLNPDIVHAMVLADPEEMGNMNGVPFATRIAANELGVRQALTDELQKHPRGGARVDQLRKMLQPIDDPLTRSDDKVDRQFVAFSPKDNGRMIEMIGTVQPGINGVGVVVPGTGTNLNGSNANHEAAVALAEQSRSPVFLYMDGDFPQDYGEAADPKYADVMADRLVDFGHEIDREVGRSAPGTPVTYVGHSYGGAIVGTAEQRGLDADRVVHVESAGTGIDDSRYTNPNPDVQRYSLTAPGDPIALVQSASRDMDLSDVQVPVDIDQIPGVPHTTDGRIGNPLGGYPGVTDPDEIRDVIRLDTGYYSDNNRGHPGEVIVGPDSHGKYWEDPGSDAFRNIAAVVGGGEATAYVERGIQTNNVDINVDDDGEFGAEAWDQGQSVAAKEASGADLPGQLPPLPTDDEWEEPWENPRVTDNPERGHKITVK